MFFGYMDPCIGDVGLSGELYGNVAGASFHIPSRAWYLIFCHVIGGAEGNLSKKADFGTGPCLPSMLQNLAVQTIGCSLKCAMFNICQKDFHSEAMPYLGSQCIQVYLFG